MPVPRQTAAKNAKTLRVHRELDPVRLADVLRGRVEQAHADRGQAEAAAAR